MPSARIQQHKEKLASSRRRLDEVLDSIGDRWDTPVYSEGAAWTVRQLAIHLMVSDKGHNNMMMAIAKGENTIPEDFDLERFNRRSVEKRADTPVEDIRRALKTNREELNAWLDSIDDATLEKQGRHGSMRILSIAQILDVAADHERHHAEDIARALNIEA